MPRRRESGFDLLIQLPWYIPAVLGVLLWLGAPLIAHFIAGASPLLAKTTQSVIGVAHLMAYVCFGAAAISSLRGLFIRRKFAAQRSLADLRALTWQQFEAIVGEAFRRKGYSVVETGQGGADGGVDLILAKDDQRYLVQCKQYRASTVGVTTVREIFGVVAARRAKGAIVVTTGQFTKDALDFARSQPIELIDGAQLEAMVQGINSVAGALSATVEVDKTEEEGIPAAAPCPRCSSPMVLRTARETGDQFYGCSTYPRCRGTRQV